jgi:hypothetical protein
MSDTEKSPSPEASAEPEVSTAPSDVAVGATVVPGELSDHTEETGGGINQRRSRWETSGKALKYLGSISRDDGLKIRDTDRATSIALLTATILIVISPWVTPLGAMRPILVVVCDILVGAMMFFYISNRFGILNTFSPRQALLTWQLMLVFAYVGVYIAINMAVIIGFAVSNTSIQLGQ